MTTGQDLRQRLASLNDERRSLRTSADLNGPLQREIETLRARIPTITDPAERQRAESRFEQAQDQRNQARVRLAEISEEIQAVDNQIFELDRANDTTSNKLADKIYGTEKIEPGAQDREIANRQNPAKPDGTPVDNAPANTALPSGSAERTTGQTESSAVDNVKDGKTSITDPPGTTGRTTGGSNVQIVANPLLNFASYSPLWTMACLTKEQYNNPSIYRNNDAALKNIIFSSGGRFDSQRATTALGVPEYFIDNFLMTAIIAPTPQTGNQNAIGFSFDVLEPHSMGVFLQSMQAAALKENFVGYLDAPYVLKLEFKGYDEKMNIYNIVKPKYFVMKVTKITFEVKESGSLYKVNGVPYNHQAFGDTTNITYTDMKLTGENVREACDALVAVLNGNEKRLKDEGKLDKPDEYVIEFPKEAHITQAAPRSQPTPPSVITYDFGYGDAAEIPGVTVFGGGGGDTGETPGVTVFSGATPSSSGFDPNDIGASSFGFTAESGGNFRFSAESTAVDPETGKVIRDKITIDPKKREFLFSQRQAITDIITKLVETSRYAKEALKPERLTDDGFVRWFKLDVQMLLLDYDPKIGDFARKIIFRVVPHLAHHSLFSNPSAPSYGLPALEKKIVKKYEYIYTGQNVDVLNFGITVNNLFFAGAAPAPEAATASVANPNQRGAGENPERKVTTGQGPSPQAQASDLGRRRVFRDPKLLEQERKGGANDKSVEQKVAETFNKIFTEGTSADLVTVELEVLGDTYWLVDSGISNHFSPPQAQSNFINEDGTANYQGSDVYIYIIFRTPSDVNTTSGLYDFPNAGKVSPFAGIYRVTRCESMFNGGVFKQKLRCIRIPQQTTDFGGVSLPTSKEDAMIAKFGDERKPSTNPTQTAPGPETVDLLAGFTPPAIPSLAALPNIGSIDRFVNSLGDPNAPPYTGDDPIVRARLGLPPVEVNQGTGAFGEEVAPGDLPQ